MREDELFAAFWGELRKSAVWGGIVRGRRYSPEKILEDFPLSFSVQNAAVLAEILNAIPEDYKTCEDAILCFLKQSPQILKLLQNLDFLRE